jgi:hypothetical protein
MPRRINISEARARLPELARYVIHSPERVVMIEHRDLPDTLVLTTESHLNYLHTVIRELRKQNGSEFRLAGSIQSDLSAEELEAELDSMRREQRLADEKRLRSFGE